MKKNKMMRVASALLVAVLLTTCVISGTFAKYVTEYDPTATARVAKWAFEIEGTESTTEDITFNLFDTITEANGAAETDIATDEKLIAPGTGGSFSIDLTNLSEVSAEYKIAYSLTNAGGVPIEFSAVGGADATDWSSDISDFDVTTAIALNMDATNQPTPTIYWRWAIGDSTVNNADTLLGLDGTATVTVTATITVEQVD